MRQGDVPKKDPIFLQDEALTPCEGIIFRAKRIGGQTRAIGLVGGEALDAVDAIGGCGRSFMGSEIADQVRAVTRDRLPPVAGIFGERLLAGANASITIEV